VDICCTVRGGHRRITPAKRTIAIFGGHRARLSDLGYAVRPASRVSDIACRDEVIAAGCDVGFG
jgi:hypothetical protein